MHKRISLAWKVVVSTLTVQASLMVLADDSFNTGMTSPTPSILSPPSNSHNPVLCRIAFSGQTSEFYLSQTTTYSDLRQLIALHFHLHKKFQLWEVCVGETYRQMEHEEEWMWRLSLEGNTTGCGIQLRVYTIEEPLGLGRFDNSSASSANTVPSCSNRPKQIAHIVERLMELEEQPCKSCRSMQNDLDILQELVDKLRLQLQETNRRVSQLLERNKNPITVTLTMQSNHGPQDWILKPNSNAESSEITLSDDQLVQQPDQEAESEIDIEQGCVCPLDVCEK